MKGLVSRKTGAPSRGRRGAWQELAEVLKRLAGFIGLRASSYEPDWPGCTTYRDQFHVGLNMRNYSLVSEMRRRVVARNSRNKANMAEHKVITFVPIIAVSLLSNGIVMMWKIQQAKQDDAEFIRRIHPAFIPVTGLKCSYGKISSSPVPRSREPSPPTLSYEHIKKFYKGFRGKARSRKPGQPGLSGSCEEALRRITFFVVHISVNFTWRSIRLIR